MNNPNNIQEYVGNKVATIVEDNYTKRINYLEGILNSQKICHNGNCDWCNTFIEGRQCDVEKRIEHFHCYECFAIICFKCDKRHCKKCQDRIDFLYSF